MGGRTKLDRGAYQEFGEGAVHTIRVLSQRQGDVTKHDEVGCQDRQNVRVALSVNLILNGALQQHKK